MTHITICEQAGTDTNALVIFDHGKQYSITVTDPFTEAEEARLKWYFEQHLYSPFTQQVRAREATAGITAYGEALFKQLFADPDAYARYKAALQSGVENLAFEIVGSPEFHSLHWEALKDPRMPQPLALQAWMVRSSFTHQTVYAEVRPSPTVNLLIVTARPGGARDIGCRTITRPLVEGLQLAAVPVHVEILRPGTYPALVDHLEAIQDRHGTGYYHVIHFDVHSALLSSEQIQAGAQADEFLFRARYGRGVIKPYEGLKAFLALEGVEDGKIDLVEAQELADLLIAHQVPIVILNAGQSGKQVRAEGDDKLAETRETNLGSRLMTAGVQVVLAMGYSITVTAAELLMTTLYEQLFAGQDLTTAIRRGRLELYNNKGRRAYFNQTIDLEDWLLPVVYQNRELQLQTRDFAPEERVAYSEGRARRYRSPKVTYGFLGRDLDVLHIEKRLLNRRNLLLIRGMGGAGKTTLLHHLAEWWQTTGFVERVCYFGYDAKAWSRQQIMAAVARELMPEAEYVTTFQPLKPRAQEAMLARRLRATRHLLILDNLESITGTHLAIRNTLPEDERRCLHDFLAELAEGRTVVLLGSRGGEDWLAPGTFDDNVYDLPGLDLEAASTLADRILERHHATQYRQDENVQRLLDLLAGYPLPMEVVLANLARQTPAQVLEALQTGDEAIDMRSEKKTESILRCIDYSHSNLSPEAQQLLTCLAPFTSLLQTDLLPQYTDRLRQQPALAHLPFDRWEEVLREAADWGLLSPHPQISDCLSLQPILPYFLRSRLAPVEQAETKRAIETAFRLHYDGLGDAIFELLNSKEAQEKRVGQTLAHLEYENMITALNLALEAQVSMLNPYRVLSAYLDTTQDHRRGLELGETVLTRLEGYPSEALSGQLGAEFVGVLDDIASRQLQMKHYAAAEASYQKASSLLLDNKGLEANEIRKLGASVYHQLGRVAEAQRQWAQAEQYYHQALQIKVEFNDRYSQASTYHQLGRVAQEQRQWVQAEQYYQQALQIKIEFNDLYSQASTYHQLGRVAQEQRQWAQSEQYYQTALTIYMEFNDRYEQAGTYHELGVVAQARRQWAQAEQYYQQALEIFIEFNDRYSQARTYHQMGRVAQEQRQWVQAEQYFQQALEIFIEFKDRYSQATTYNNVAIVAQEQRQWAKAEQYFQQALEIYIEFNDRYHQAGTYHQMGRVAEDLGQEKQAQQYLLQALEIFQGARDEHKAMIALRSVARLYQASGDASIPEAVAKVMDVSPEEAEELLRAVA